MRPWISPDFGTSWQSIPNNTLAGDQLDGNIKSLIFASATALCRHPGGWRLSLRQAGMAWTRTQLDTMGGTSALPLAGVVTDIAVDRADGSGNSIYVTFGGSGDYRHVWHFNGASGTSGRPGGGDPDALLDVQHNAIVVDPMNPTHVYAGADIGIWRSTAARAGRSFLRASRCGRAGSAAAQSRRILRASTHGRGVYERTLDALPKQEWTSMSATHSSIRAASLSISFLPDRPAGPRTSRIGAGPTLKLDTPDVDGDYQFP